MISLTAQDSSVLFTFEENQHYLYSGTIEVPKNSLTLVTDESEMFTFRKAANNDVFLSGLYSELGMTKAELEEFFAENMVGGGVSPEDLSNYYTKSETSGATQIATALSGKANTADTYTKSEVDTALSGKADTATTYTKTEVDTALSGKQDTLSAGTNITIENNVISAAGSDAPISASTGTNSIKANYSGNRASGNYSFAEGYGTTASGSYSHAECDNTIASGSYSHAEGSYSQAYGQTSHAEGQNTYTSSSAMFAHAEGYISQAYGQASHAEGRSSSAMTHYSHTEGDHTKTSNESEHASGQYNTTVSASTTFGDSGNTLFSVGNGTSAATHNAFEIRQNGDIYIVKDGNDVLLQDQLGGSGSDLPISAGTGTNSIKANSSGNTASGRYSFAEGASTTANGNYSHAEGTNTTASGDCSHAEGSWTEARGFVSHTEGYETEAYGRSSHAEGNYTIANGDYSHAEGNTTTASGSSSHAEGINTSAMTQASHAEGRYTKTSNEAEHASGQYNTTVSASTTFGDSGNTLFSVGNGTSAATHNAFEIRQNGDIYITKDGSDVLLQDQLGNGGGNNVIELTQAEYDALTEIDPDAFYIITDATAIDIADYYTKSETSGATQIATALSGKVDTSALTESYSSATEIATALSGKQDTLSAGTNITISGNVISSVGSNAPISAGTGTNSIKANYSSNIASGQYSFAEGSGTTASGLCSHSEGQYTIASGNCSHAEGFLNYANGDYSHAEGSGNYANEDYSHAEGLGTSAMTKVSHAEGSYTKTSNLAEHASGQYNTTVSASTIFGNSGNTLFSVGNGMTENSRHNAFEIRQNGDIYIVKDGNDVLLQDQLGGSGSEYTAGYAIDITDDVISMSLPISADSRYVCIGNTSSPTRRNGSILIGNASADSFAYNSLAIGSNSTTKTNATGEESVAIGSMCNANGINSTAIGRQTTASGNSSVAIGETCVSSTRNSVTLGTRLKVSNNQEISIGSYNTTVSASTTFGDSGNTLFSVGNGTAENARHNAFEVRQNGDIYITSGGTDILLQDNLGGSSITMSDVNTAISTAISNKFWCGTQTEYDAIETKDADVIYLIHE